MVFPLEEYHVNNDFKDVKQVIYVHLTVKFPQTLSAFIHLFDISFVVRWNIFSVSFPFATSTLGLTIKIVCHAVF